MTGEIDPSWNRRFLLDLKRGNIIKTRSGVNKNIPRLIVRIKIDNVGGKSSIRGNVKQAYGSSEGEPAFTRDSSVLEE